MQVPKFSGYGTLVRGGLPGKQPPEIKARMQECYTLFSDLEIDCSRPKEMNASAVGRVLNKVNNAMGRTARNAGTFSPIRVEMDGLTGDILVYAKTREAADKASQAFEKCAREILGQPVQGPIRLPKVSSFGALKQKSFLNLIQKLCKQNGIDPDAFIARLKRGMM